MVMVCIPPWIWPSVIWLIGAIVAIVGAADEEAAAVALPACGCPSEIWLTGAGVAIV